VLFYEKQIVLDSTVHKQVLILVTPKSNNRRGIYFMKRKLLMVVLGAVLTVSCDNSKTTSTTEKAKPTVVATTTASVAKTANEYRADLTTVPVAVKANENTTLTLNLKNAQGEAVKDLQIAHEKPMHLLAVSKDLSEFYHLHPEPQPDGSFVVKHKFPNGGDYKLFADFTPANAEQTVAAMDVKVAGKERKADAMIIDTFFSKTTEGLSVVMENGAALVAGEESMLTYKLTDAKNNKPVTNLQKYLGEDAHFVIVSEDLKEFVHAHPMKMEPAAAATPAAKKSKDDIQIKPSTDIMAHVVFPKAGAYKIWAQFQRADKVITVPFIVSVSEKKAK
jgi:hypothetical protein